MPASAAEGSDVAAAQRRGSCCGPGATGAQREMNATLLFPQHEHRQLVDDVVEENYPLALGLDFVGACFYSAGLVLQRCKQGTAGYCYAYPSLTCGRRLADYFIPVASHHPLTPGCLYCVPSRRRLIVSIRRWQRQRAGLPNAPQPRLVPRTDDLRQR